MAHVTQVFDALVVAPTFLCGRAVTVANAVEKRGIARQQLQGHVPLLAGDDRPTFVTQETIAWALSMPPDVHVHVGITIANTLVYFVNQKQPTCLFNQTTPFSTQSVFGLVLETRDAAQRIEHIRALLVEYSRRNWETVRLERQLEALTTKLEASNNIDAALGNMDLT